MSLLVQDIVKMAVTQLEEAGVPDAKQMRRYFTVI